MNNISDRLQKIAFELKDTRDFSDLSSHAIGTKLVVIFDFWTELLMVLKILDRAGLNDQLISIGDDEKIVRAFFDAANIAREDGI